MWKLWKKQGCCDKTYILGTRLKKLGLLHSWQTEDCCESNCRRFRVTEGLRFGEKKQERSRRGRSAAGSKGDGEGRVATA
jgi:hypothetical protein